MQYCNTTNVSIVLLGRQGEHLARAIEFYEPAEWAQIYGAGEVQLVNLRPGENTPYPVALRREEERVVWDVTAADTALSGYGKCELQYLVGETVVKSRIYTTLVMNAMTDDVTETPEPQQGWVEQVLKAGAAAEEAAYKAENALSCAPRIGENGNWWIWNAANGAYEDTGEYSGGAAPYIGGNNNWYIGNEDTGVSAMGRKGDKGDPGKSAYQYAVEGGYGGTEEEFKAKQAKEIVSTSDLTNDSGFITKAVDDLANYYLKSETYTQNEVDSRISLIPKFKISVVDSLPTEYISIMTVYLLKSGDDGQNLYTEYIFVVSSSVTVAEGDNIQEAQGAWEKLGEQTVNLTGYATESFVKEYAQPVGNYALKTEIPAVPVQSVNGKTGTVLLNAADVGAVPLSSTLTMEGIDEEGVPHTWIIYGVVQ